MAKSVRASICIQYLNMWTIFFLSLTVSLFANLVFEKTALRFGFVDVAKGDALKIHHRPIPYVGGVAMFVAAALSLLFMAPPDMRPLFFGVVLAALPVLALGFWDDMKWKHQTQAKPFLKFAFLILIPLLAATILWIAGWRLDFPSFFLFVPASAFAIFVLMNSINYQDGMDGLAGSLTAVSFGGFAIVSFLLGNSLDLILSLAFMGAVLGFLALNLPPARMFMGDSGAYVLGFFLALLVLLFIRMDAAGALLLAGFPLAEGIWTNCRRLMQGKSIFYGDRSHVYDRMLQAGLSPWKTLAFLIMIQIALVGTGILLFI
ncbi:MAG: hypothetical protein UY78_C0001G0027 [Parcubacteria group bacterium GW2011_GWA1_53_13]|uniref:Uncharacterized protein n=1 Tax=Candidatus Giovannonibacteria bacterium GW2011_GWB1_47_6b TaxID=1618655 RepID=A0A0G1T524_9BACT|nr:MAG: hypothetical protein UY02_C0010G0018 [Candidatus Giovannonibacteria bacterium GW2011_GWB1_47_6b]KKW33869.1 MAG: hypothetical protein UY78_C0001G0027 [Parcubacteria group bacterium GW2011_GWA1_53_13]